jgi:four helix bundle protein
MTSHHFDHERLEVYHLAREFNRETRALLLALPQRANDSKKNLERAAKSVTRNVAEGGGRWSVPDKTHFYHMARASATECAASLDELVDFGLMTAERVEPLKKLLARIVAALIAMIRSMEARASMVPAPAGAQAAPRRTANARTRG